MLSPTGSDSGRGGCGNGDRYGACVTLETTSLSKQTTAETRNASIIWPRPHESIAHLRNEPHLTQPKVYVYVNQYIAHTIFICQPSEASCSSFHLTGTIKSGISVL